VPDPLEDLSDEALAIRARTGDMACFELLVRRFQVPLMHFLFKKCGRSSEAQDILQEVFLKAWLNIGNYKETWPFRTWIYTITHRMAISTHRKIRLVANSESLNNAPASSEGPHEIAQQQETNGQLWNLAQRTLSPEQYTALWLTYVEDMPGPQVASVLGKSWVSIKTMLHRSRKKLHSELTLAQRPKIPALSADPINLRITEAVRN
jgi:RNA polymerase sigma-70 factor (ECF subfamily)